VPGHKAVSDYLTGLFYDEPSTYPATKGQLVSLVSGPGLDGYRPNPDDRDWFSTSLPDGRYRDPGEVIAALTPVFEWLPEGAIRGHGEESSRQGASATATTTANHSSSLSSSHAHLVPVSAFMVGARLIVRENQAAVLVRQGAAYDLFSSGGSYTLTPETAPKLSAVSRPPAKGFEHGAFEGAPLFLDLNEFNAEFATMARTKAGKPFAARGAVRCAILSPADLLKESNILRQLVARSGGDDTTADAVGVRRMSSDPLERLVQRQTEDTVRRVASSHQMEEMKGDKTLLEKPIDDALANLGLKVNSIIFDAIGEPTPGMFFTGAQPTARDMQEMMERLSAIAKLRQASGLNLPPQFGPAVQTGAGTPASPAHPSTGPSPTSTGAAANSSSAGSTTIPRTSSSPSPFPPPTTTLVCSKCGVSNPGTGKFCGECGAALQPPNKRTCPNCGSDVLPNIRFCGNCGTRVG
jgi:hypothetical protein